MLLTRKRFATPGSMNTKRSKVAALRVSAVFRENIIHADASPVVLPKLAESDESPSLRSSGGGSRSFALNMCQMKRSRTGGEPSGEGERKRHT